MASIGLGFIRKAFWSIDEEEIQEVEESILSKKLVDREQEFHDFVRQQIICMWLFMALYLLAYWVISRLKRKTEREDLYAGEEDYFVYRVSVWMCSISMAVSIGSLLLLPFSVIGVELLQLYENNYYLQWLSYSLIGSLWNYVFTLSNLSLFVLLPFSYFFIESQGFSNAQSHSGITQRVYETLAICALFIVVVLCLAEIVLTIIKYPVSFLSITSVNLPLIYSCVSLSGALLLLISTPYGFAKMFSFFRELLDEKKLKTNDEDVVVKQEEADEAEEEEEEARKDSDSGIESGSTEEMKLDSEDERILKDDVAPEALRRRRRKHDYADGGRAEERRTRFRSECDVDFDWKGITHHLSEAAINRSSMVSPFGSTIGSPLFASTPMGMTLGLPRKLSERRSRSEEALHKISTCYSSSQLWRRAADKVKNVMKFSKNSRRGRMWSLILGLRLPTIFAILLVFTSISLVMVAINTLKLLFGYRSLPTYAQYIEVHTRHSFGLFGAIVETLIIVYVMLTSFVGIYSLPLLRSIRPVRNETSMTAIIINSSLVLVASSALPVIVNTLGMTTFDLLGAYSSLQWLSSFRAVLTYNLLFVILSVAFLFNSLTASMRREIWKRLSQLRYGRRKKVYGIAENDQRNYLESR